MKFPPAWKVKREIRRIWTQVSEITFPLFEQAAQKRYDANFKKLTELYDGKATASKKIVVFFIFQPQQLAKSIFATCEFLQKQGYSLLIVSSAKICDEDFQALQSIAWKILLRPNYGYDFGGYRDGFRTLDELGVKPDTILILNDSVWLPLDENSKMITAMENDGLLLNGPVFESVIKREKHKEYFQSYLMLVKSKALNSAALKTYWRDYRVSSRKSIVLVRGEEGFSEALLNAGFGGGTSATRSVLFRLIQKQPNIFLLKTLEYATYLDGDLLYEARELIRCYFDSDEWRHKALLHINSLPTTAQPMGIVPYACIKLLGFSFLKKSSFPPEHDGMRWQYLRAVKNGDLPAPHPDILAEIMASKMAPALTTDPSIPAPESATKTP